MAQRPTSMTVIGWLLIVFGTFGVIGMLMLPNNPVAVKMLEQSPLPLSVHMAIGAIGALVSAACGYGVLKGLGWSRLLYTGWFIGAIAIALITTPFNSLMLLGWLLNAVVIFFLFRPAANAWLGQGAAAGVE